MMAEYSQTYWNELIDQYRNGTISDQDRFQLEKQALDDPFLFDALEGFSLYEDEVKEKDSTSTKIFTLPRMAVAASIIVLVAFLFNMNLNTDSQIGSDKTIAMVLEDDEEAEATKERKGSDINSIVSTSSKSDETNAPEAVLPENEIKPKWKVEHPEDDKIKMDRPAKVNPPAVSQPAKDFVEINENKVSEDNIGSNEIAELDLTKDEIEAVPIDQAKEEVVLDVANAASLESEAESDDPQLIVPVTSDSSAKKEESSKRKKSQVMSYFEAVPVIGKAIFDDYAKERIDERGLRQSKPQEVTIEFTIDKNGNLTNFHHIFTGCSECGPFAISILQNSGEWKTVPPGFSGKARYTFMF